MSTTPCPGCGTPTYNPVGGDFYPYCQTCGAVYDQARRDIEKHREGAEAEKSS